MDLIDILDRKLIVETDDDDDDDFDANMQRSDEICEKMMAALNKWGKGKIKLDEEDVHHWLFGGGGGDVNQVADAIINGVAKVFDYDHEDAEQEAFIKFFKAMGLTRGDALFVLDQS